MNNKRFTQIGLDRLVRLKWLATTSNLVLAKNDLATVKTILQEELSDDFQSKNVKVRGSIDKTITILMKIWAKTPLELRPLNDEGLHLLSYLLRDNHVAVHWGMTMSVYPFWAAVAFQTGRLLKLQGNAAASQVQRRVREQYGERETVSRRVRYILRSFLDWGVLNETGDKGVYDQGKQYLVEDPRLIAWMVEASLRARVNGSAAIKDLLDSPSIFPFRLAHISAEHVASLSPRLNILRHGLDDDLVMLKSQNEA